MIEARKVVLKNANNDILYNSYFQEKLEKSRDDIENGRVMTIEESIEKMRKKYESFDIR